MLCQRPTDLESLEGLGRVLHIFQVVVVHWDYKLAIWKDGRGILRVLENAMNLLFQKD